MNDWINSLPLSSSRNNVSPKVCNLAKRSPLAKDKGLCERFTVNVSVEIEQADRKSAFETAFQTAATMTIDDEFPRGGEKEANATCGK